jgi:tetratricopeptide (TPR) repeat protein
MRVFLSLMIALIVAGCASSPTGSNGAAPSESAQAKMDSGTKALSQENYGEAAQIFDAILVQNPASEFDLLASYNSGVAYEGLGECKKASERFRQVATGSANKFQRIEAEALYRLSMTYECLADDKKTISALLDARKRVKFLPHETADAELPARLAAAYARIGQRQKALEYFKEAGNGLKLALTQAGGTTNKIQQQFAARTLYSMGQLTTSQRSLMLDAKSFLQSISLQQPFLLQAAEINVAPSSRKAADDLIFVYENMQKLTPNKEAEVRAFYELALQDIAEIKRIRLPNKGVMVEEIFNKIDVQESRIRQALMSQSEITPLTQDAERREGLKRQGRVVGPTTILEEKRKKSQQ